jgi:hypothetical protein
MTKPLSAVLLFAAMLAACTAHGTQTIPAMSSAVQGSNAHLPDEPSWRDSLARTTLPEAGCFRTAYPSTAWTRVPCSTVTHEIFPPNPKRALRPNQIGGAGGQVEAYVDPPSLIEEAIGSFPSVSGVKSEHNIPAGGGKSFGPDTFTLQMNSEFFATAACGANVNCLGWEQFVFSNYLSGKQNASQLFIQDWLVATGSSALVCPSGWTQAQKSCVHNSKGSTVPYVPVETLDTLKMWGYALSGGDSVFLAIGSHAYAVREAQSDRTVDLAAYWSRVQFNVLGDGGGSVAVFNPGSSLTVQLEVVTAHTQVRPLCVLTASTTAESNSLNYSSIPGTPQPAQFPSIVFAESNARNAGNAQCRSLGAAT